MAYHNENELFKEAAKRASRDRKHTIARTRGIKTLQEFRLREITAEVFRQRRLVPIIGELQDMFQRIVSRLCSFFGIHYDD